MTEVADAVDGLPIPMGVLGDTGETPPSLTAELSGVARDSKAALAKASRPRALGVQTESDHLALAQTGWGVLFASDADPTIEEALKPLLEWRQSQVNDERRFRVFKGNADGVRVHQTADSWASARGVGLAAPVRPEKGVPYYLMIVGTPERIPFDFQQQIDLQWAVGRLHFDTIEAYAEYARRVVAYEQRSTARPKHIAVWMPSNGADLATRMLAGTMGPEFRGEAPDSSPLGNDQHFALSTFIGEGQATKAQLSALLKGEAAAGPPAILFTGSHGAEWPIEDPERQRRLQGALVTQEWVRGVPLDERHYVCAEDLAAGDSVDGLIAFLFACFGGACPMNDSYYTDSNGRPRELARAPIIAQLPQRLLARGALAVVAHVDRAFAYGFQNPLGTPQPQLLRDPLVRLMKGERVGHAVDTLNLAWGTQAATLALKQATMSAGGAVSPALKALAIARDDARNYIVLGDPATRVR